MIPPPPREIPLPATVYPPVALPVKERLETSGSERSFVVVPPPPENESAAVPEGTVAGVQFEPVLHEPPVAA